MSAPSPIVVMDLIRRERGITVGRVAERTGASITTGEATTVLEQLVTDGLLIGTGSGASRTYMPVTMPELDPTVLVPWLTQLAADVLVPIGYRNDADAFLGN